MDILPQIIVNGLIAGSVYALVGLGFSLIFSATRFFNLAHGIFAVVGAYGVFFATRWWHMPAYLAIPFGLLIAGLAGVLLDRALFAPLRRRYATSMVMLVASLGAFTALQALIAILFTSQFQQLAPPSSAALLVSIGSIVVTKIQLTLIATSIIVWAMIAAVLRFTKFGRAVRAVSDDREVATIVGIETEKIICLLFFIGATITGGAGILYGYDTGIDPAMGLMLLLDGVSAAIIGGLTRPSGVILGGFILGLAEHIGIWKISGEWKDAIAFIVLIIFLLVRPQGILKSR